MGKVVLIFLVFSIAVSRLDAQYFIDNDLVGTRQEYANYKWNCFEYIEIYDLKLYSSLNTSVFSVLDVLLKQQSLLATCENFNTSRLNKTTRSNLKTTCNSLNVTFQQAVPEARSTLMSFYSSVGSQSELMDLAHELFTAVKEVLNNLVPAHSTHPKCVSRHLRTLSNTYRFTSGEIAGLQLRLHRRMSKAFNKPFAASRAALNTLQNFRINLSKCDNISQTDPDECVNKLVNNFRECGKNCDSINDIVMEPIKSISFAMADFNNLYNKEFEKASKSVEIAKTNLSKWSDQVENCQNENSSSARTSSSASSSTLPSTQTTAAIQNLTILQIPTTVRISPTITVSPTLPTMKPTMGIVPTLKTIRTG